MNRYIFHWKSGNPEITFADSVKEAANKLGFGGGILGALDYWEEQKEIPYPEKLVMAEGESIKNPAFIGQIKKHTPLSVGETMIVTLGTRVYPMTVTEITGCTINFHMQISKVRCE